MEVKSRSDIRRALNMVRQKLYDADLALDDGDRDLLLRTAKEAQLMAGHVVDAIARWHFTTPPTRITDRSHGLFPISAPPVDDHHDPHNPRRDRR